MGALNGIYTAGAWHRLTLELFYKPYDVTGALVLGCALIRNFSSENDVACGLAEIFSPWHNTSKAQLHQTDTGAVLKTIAGARAGSRRVSWVAR